MNKVWKIYFYLILVITLIEYSLRLIVSTEIADEFSFSISKQAELILTVIWLIGLYGFIYKRKIFNRAFWAVFFIFLSVYTGWATYEEVQFNQRLDQMFPGVEAGLLEYFLEILGFVLSLPMYIGLFIYSYKSNNLWTKPA